MAVRTEVVVKHSKTRVLPLVFEIHADQSADSPVAKPNKSSAHAVNSKGGLLCLMPSTLAPPDPGGLSLATGFFFQVADLWGFSRETKGLNVFDVGR